MVRDIIGLADDFYIETDIDACRGMWEKFRSGLPDGDWTLRKTLAEHYGVQPYFIVSERTGHIIPCGKIGNCIRFYGGEKYAERNFIFGDQESDDALLQALFHLDYNVQLLSWERDPVGSKDGVTHAYEVPFNQYWVIKGDADYESHLLKLRPNTLKESSYLSRKFEFKNFDLRCWSESADLVCEFIEKTSLSFRKRQKPFVFDTKIHRDAALLICERAFQKSALKLVGVIYNEVPVGLCVIIDDKDSSAACYMLNLYSASPSDASNGVTLAAVDYSCRNRRRLDGMRGSFTLKRKYGFVPEPSYALVRDASWKVHRSTDLSESEILELYGRRI